MIRMNVNRILPLMLLLVLFASCSRKYKVEGVSSVTSLDGKMLYLKTLRDGQWTLPKWCTVCSQRVARQTL